MIETNELHIWLACPKDIVSPSLLSQYEALLSREEQERRERFLFPRHQHAFLVTRALVRSVLSAYVGLPPEALTFTANEYGRPELAMGSSGDTLRFNVSHTDDRIVLLVNRLFDAGIDIEDATRVKKPTQIAEHFFSASEVRDLFALPDAERRGRFFSYWTLKEAFIKAKGMGLAIPLRDFSFHLDDQPGGVRISFSGSLVEEDPKAWSFGLWQLTDTIRLAVACQRGCMVPDELSIREVVPLLASETAIQLKALAVTQDN